MIYRSINLYTMPADRGSIEVSKEQYYKWLHRKPIEPGTCWYFGRNQADSRYFIAVCSLESAPPFATHNGNYAHNHPTANLATAAL